MPAREPDPPSRDTPGADPVVKPSEDAFIRAVSERPPPAQPPHSSSSPGIDTTVDDVLVPPAPPTPDLAVDSLRQVELEPPPMSRATESAGDDGGGAEADDLVGALLSKTYEIVRAVGEGGMGRVYEARHTRIASKRFAVKTLHPEYLRQPDILARFQREAEAAAAIDSPHVVGVVDVDHTRDGRPFLVTEFLDGEDLGAKIKRAGKLSTPSAVGIVRQVCRALMAAHARGIVHRDIKPENVFLCGSPQAPTAKVLDFGISRIASEAGNSLTKTGMIMGTPAYMSPEQARGSRVDHRTDIYALGAVLYTALTGREPFELDEPSAVLAAVLTRDPERPRAIEPTVDESLELIIQQAMAKEPDHRFADAAELHAALAPYDVEGEGEAELVPGDRSQPWRQRSHVRPVGSRARSTTWDLPVKLARPGLVLTALVGFGWAVALTAQAVGAAVRMARQGQGLRPTETLIVLLIGSVTLVTPIVMTVRFVRQHVWHNTAKVLALTERIWTPLATSILTFGLLGMALRTLEANLLDQPSRVAWPVWTLLLTVTSVASAVGSGLARRATQRPHAAKSPTARLRRELLPATLAAGGVLLTAGAIGTALYLRGRVAPTPTAAAATNSASVPSPTAAGTTTKAMRATTVEIEAAKQQGVAGLETLRKRYPQDPVVLQALVLARGATPEGLAPAIDLAEELLRMEPAAADDEGLARFVYKAAGGSDTVSNKAFSLLSKSMGPRGPDLLYELWIAGGARSHRAERLLDNPDVRTRGTPALRIAVDMRKADGCRAKGALLDRAAAEGDARVIAVLKPLSTGTRRGCGFLDLSPCPARCSAQAAKMKQTIRAIRTRSQ